MTLIVTVASPHFILQVGDRLLTTSAGKKTQEFDANSNKNLIFEASNGLVTISYCGVAFINGRPTDEWIAMQLHPLGERILESGTDPCTIQLGPSASTDWLSAYGVVKRLRERLSELPDSATKDSGITVVIAGWRYKRLENKSFLVELTKSRDPSKKAVKATGSRKKPGTSGNFALGMVGTGASAETWAYLTNYWKEIHTQEAPDSLEEYARAIQDIMVATVKFASTIEPSVGANVHAVVLWKSEQYRYFAETHFSSAHPHPVTITTPTREIKALDAAVTGWILFNGAVYAPSYLIGVQTLSGRATLLKMNGGDMQDHTKYLFTSITRRRI